MENKKVGIIGYGRFGKFWASLLRKTHQVLITDIEPVDSEAFVSLADLCSQSEVIFICVPIGRFEGLVHQIKHLVQPGTLVFDTCSVKVHPSNVLETVLGENPGVQLIAAHPMFGPDSAGKSPEGLPIVTWPLGVGRTQEYENWTRHFNEMGLEVVELSPDAHDRLAAYSQGVTHYIGRVLEKLNLVSTPIDTQGFSILLSLIEQTCNDSWELFHDLQIHNPYTREMRLKLEAALDEVYASLLPERVSMDKLVIGIQGGEGSFSEEACRLYIAQQSEFFPEWRIEYLYTTDNVLRALHQGEIDFGVFAIQNARGGVVMESIQALSSYNCEIDDMFDLVINHCILHHPAVHFDQVDTLISHPQALAQCANSLADLYPQLVLTSGAGEMIDQALCARRLAEGLLPRTTAVLASSVCAKKNNLTIHDHGLQDLGDANLTSFLWVHRKKRATR